MFRGVRGIRAAALATAMALVAGLATVAGAPSAGAEGGPRPGWARTATAATDITGATPLGPAPATTPLPVLVTLKTPDPAGLSQLLAAQDDPRSPQFHRYLTPAQFTGAFGATPAQVDDVVTYLQSQGMTGIQVAPNRLSVTAQATAGTATHAFATTLGTFRRQGRTVVTNTAPALVPSRLSATVDGVVGLDQAAQAKPLATRLAAATPGTVTAHDPDQFPAIYDAASLPAAQSTSLAVMAEGNLSPVISDLRLAETQHSLPQVPVTTVPTGAPSSDTNNQLEWDLDTQSSTGMAGNLSQLYLYDAPSLDDLDITTEIQRWASDDHATVASASFGLCDSDAQSDGTASAIDSALAQAQAQGQAFFAATGDTGASCVTASYQTVRQTSYPASSPYATAVGGTTLATNGTSWAGETAWNDGSGASGGGISNEPRPAYANDADAADTPDPIGSGRGVPDLAMDGDPASGAYIVVQGSTQPIGGTSLSSPLAAGAWARMETAHHNDLGLASAALYGLYNNRNGTGPGGATPGLHDVTTGNNSLGGISGYQARVGYDLTTGLGTLDAAQVSADLDVAPTFTADTPPSTGTVTVPYSYGFTVTGSPAPVYTISSGSLPPGLSLNATTGVLSGTPTKAGSSTFAVTAANGVSPNATSPNITVTVGEPSGGQGDAAFQGSTGNIHLNKPIVGMAVDSATGGYWLVASDGGIFAFNAPFYGSAGNLSLKQPIVGMAATPDGGGYYLVASDGGIFTFGDAHFQGSTGNLTLAKPIVGMAVDSATGGYWLDASDGGIFTFNAPFYGSAGALPLVKPVVGMAATPDGSGYYLVASDGGIFTFGDAHFQGSTGNIRLNKPIVGMAVDSATGGYWLDASDGGIFTFNAPFYGSAGALPLVKPVVGMTATPSGLGYYLVASDGGIFTY